MSISLLIFCEFVCKQIDLKLKLFSITHIKQCGRRLAAIAMCICGCNVCDGKYGISIRAAFTESYNPITLFNYHWYWMRLMPLKKKYINKHHTRQCQGLVVDFNYFSLKIWQKLWCEWDRMREPTTGSSQYFNLLESGFCKYEILSWRLLTRFTVKYSPTGFPPGCAVYFTLLCFLNNTDNVSSIKSSHHFSLSRIMSAQIETNSVENCGFPIPNNFISIPTFFQNPFSLKHNIFLSSFR